MRKLLVFMLVTALMIAPAVAVKVNPRAMDVAFNKIMDMINAKKLPEDAINAVRMHQIRAIFHHKGNCTKMLSFKGILDGVNIVINGNGTKLAHLNTTQILADNGSTITLNFKYYPRNVTFKFIGYEWWSSRYQHIINGTGSVIATISETDGSWSVSDDYTSVNPIWDSLGANLTVNTSAGWLEHSVDTVAETVSVIYNFTIDDGYFTSLVWHNVSIYVAPNSTPGTGQDDLNIYYSTDGGTTWITLFDGANGSTSTGTQWTGDISLPIAGNRSVLIKIEFVSDGADDVAGQADVHIDAINITGTVSKLPTRNPKIDLNGDGVWDVEYNGSLTNGTASTEFSLGDLNLSNTITVYCEGSEKVFLNFTWYDEGRVYVKKVCVAGVCVDCDKFLAEGENVTIGLTNVTDIISPVTLTITLDTEHTLCTSYNYTLELKTYPFMLMSYARMSISPTDGVQIESNRTFSKPIPIFVKPRYADASLSVNVYNPNASVGDVFLNMTIESVHGNVVDFFLTDLPYDALDLYIDGNYVTTLNVTDGFCYFNVSNFSTHTIELYPAGALVAPPSEIDWMWVAGVIMVIVLIATMIYLFVATVRGK